MKKICLLFLSTLILFFMASRVSAANPHLSLSPSSGTISPTGTSIAVKIDTGGQAAKSAKAVLTFDATKLEILGILSGTFFDEVSHNIYNSTGQVVINANLSLGSALESKTGVGTLATLTVKAKVASGSANITFDCTPGSSIDSGINDPTPTDIIDCDSNINGSYSLSTTGASPSPATGGPLPSPSALPATGTIGPTLGILILGLGLILISLPLFLFV